MLGTLEDLRLKEKWGKEYAKYCREHVCSDGCPVMAKAKRLKAGCMLVFCRMKEAGKI